MRSVVAYATLEHMRAVGTYYWPTRIIGPTGHKPAQLIIWNSSTTDIVLGATSARGEAGGWPIRPRSSGQMGLVQSGVKRTEQPLDPL